MKGSLRSSRSMAAVPLMLAMALLVGCKDQRGAEKAPAALTHVDLLIDWKAEPTYAGFFVAEQIGAYARQGLDVRVVEGGGATLAAQVIGQGAQHFIGSSSGEATAIAVSQGVPVVSVAVLYPDVPTVIYSRADTPIKQPADLIGRRIGLINGSVTVDEYKGMMASSKIDRARVKEIGVGWDVAPLLAGKVDGLMNYAELTPVELRIQGKAIETMRLADHGLKAYSLNLIVNRDQLTKDSAIVRRVRDAVLEGYAFVREKPDSAARLFSAKFPERDTLFVRESMRVVAQQLGQGPIGQQTEAGWSQTLQTLGSLGLLKRPVTVDEVAPARWRAP